MEKRLLRKLPIPSADSEQISAAAKAGKDIRGVLVSQKKKAGGIETLVLNVYQVSGRNKRDISLQFRVFCQKKDYVTLDMESGKWRTGALLNLICRDSGWSEYWWNYNQLAFLTEKDADAAEKTFRKWLRDTRSSTEGRIEFYMLGKYQEGIRSERLARKHKKITDAIDAEMEKFGKLPDDYQAFVEERVFRDENYIFYDTKRKRAFCTSCKVTFDLEDKHLRHKAFGVWNDLDEVRHNRAVRCPYCNKFLMAKSEGMSRQSLLSVAWSVLVQPHGEEVLTRYFLHTKDFRIDFHNPRIESSEMYRTVHTAEKATDYMWARFKQADDVRWCYYRDQGSSWYPPPETVAPRSVMMYNDTLQEVVGETCMKYSVPDLFLENLANDLRYFNSPRLIDNYFNSYRKHPFIEQLLKVGFYDITREFLEDKYHKKPELYAGCNSVLGTLGVNKNQYNMLRKIGDPRMRDLEILRYKPDLKWDDFSKLRYIHDNGRDCMFKKYIDLMEYTTLHKLMGYIHKQKIENDRDYFDYVKWLEEMGYDMRSEFNLYPRDFKRAHDEKSAEYVKFQDKKAKEDIERFNKLLKKLRKETSDAEPMNLKIEGLFIRLPEELEELKTEGELLHHCVGTYRDKVAKGETMIFFIRREEDPNTPYYTLEWKGRVIQCRGFKNCDMTPKVKAFVEIFQEKMVEYEKAPQKRRKAG